MFLAALSFQQWSPLLLALVFMLAAMGTAVYSLYNSLRITSSLRVKAHAEVTALEASGRQAIRERDNAQRHAEQLEKVVREERQRVVDIANRCAALEQSNNEQIKALAAIPTPPPFTIQEANWESPSRSIPVTQLVEAERQKTLSGPLHLSMSDRKFHDPTLGPTTETTKNMKVIYSIGAEKRLVIADEYETLILPEKVRCPSCRATFARAMSELIAAMKGKQAQPGKLDELMELGRVTGLNIAYIKRRTNPADVLMELERLQRELSSSALEAL